jgi:hypothetical protein
MQEASVSRQAGQVDKPSRRSLHNETAMIKQKRAKSREFLPAACSAWTTMQAAGDHVAVACVLIANRRIDDKDSAVQVPNSEYDILNKTWIVGENGGNERPQAAACYRDEIFQAIVCD